MSNEFARYFGRRSSAECGAVASLAELARPTGWRADRPSNWAGGLGWWAWICALAAFCGMQLAARAAETERRNQEAKAKMVKRLQRLPDQITLAELSNGLTVIVQENRTAPVATVRCFVRNTGSAFEGRHLGAGLSHVLEHVVAGGSTTKRTEKEIERLIDRIGGATNAFTSDDRTVYFIDCPAKDVNLAVELIADSMARCAFAPEEFARELAVVRQELADGEVDRRRVLWKMLQQTIYLEHPARHPVIGYLDVLNRTTNDTIVAFYRERYVPNNQVFVVVGDVEADAIVENVARHFEGVPRGAETFVPMPDEPMQSSPREAVREMDGATFDLVLAWPTVRLNDPDMYALDLAAAVLSDGDSSRLVRRLKHEQPLALAVRAASNTPSYVRGFFMVQASAPPDTWRQVEKGIVEEIERLHNELITPAELAKVRKQMTAGLVFARQTVKSQAMSIGNGVLAAGDPLYESRYVEQLAKVTAEQVRDAVRRHLVPQRLNRVVLAPPGGAGATASEAAKGDESPIRREVLPNGLRVLIKRSAHLPMVNIQMCALGSALVDTPQQAGRSHLVAAMLDRGTDKHNAREIAEYFDSIGGTLNFSAGRFTISGSATVLKEDFAGAMEMFAECVTRSTFPEDEFAKVRQLALRAIEARRNSPQAEAQELFFDLLPADSPYHVIQGGKKETVGALTAEALREYRSRYFAPNNMVVSVFGDIDPEEALALVRRQFGGLKADPAAGQWDFRRNNRIAETVRKRCTTAKPTGMVILGYEGPSIFEKDDYAAITLLDAVTSGYSYPGGWLHEELRGAGLVYWVHAMPLSGPSPGFFLAMAQTHPGKVDEVVDRIEKNIQRARRGQISEEEFETAIDMVLSLHAQENTTISEQARQAVLDELYGLGYDYDTRFPERIKAVKREDLARVANKYLNHAIILTMASEPAANEAAPAQQ